MWKMMVLCSSMFGGAALGLSLGARWMEPAALPAAAAIAMCLIGVVLILAAPTAESADEASATTTALPTTPRMSPVLSHSSPRLEAIDVAPTMTTKSSTGPFDVVAT